MERRHLGFCSAIAGLILASAAGASAQIFSCGGTQNYSSIYQAGAGIAYVYATVSTTRNHDACAYKVRSEGWVLGVDGADYEEGGFEAILRIGRPVPDFTPRTVVGKHFMIQLLPPWEWFLRGVTSQTASLTPPQPTSDEEDGGDGETQERHEYGGGCEGYGSEFCLYSTPLILDPDFDGFHLTAPEVLFDIDADGTEELVGWTEVRDGKVDAWLAADWNGNGKIDDGAELFGNHTRAYLDRPDVTPENGFKALNFLQGPTFGPSNPDQQIDAQDAAWSRLLLWRDLNHNGISEPNELEPVAQSDLKAISFVYKTAGRKDANGNEFRQRAESWWDTGKTTLEKAFVFDVWLVQAGGEGAFEKR